MTDPLARWKLGAALAGVAMLAAWLFLADVRADEEKPRKEAVPMGKKPEGTRATKAFFGVKTCASAGCHLDGTKPAWLDEKVAVCECDEAKKWKAEDRHGYAYEALTSDRGKRMGKLLGYGDDPKTWKSCLTCHAVWIDKKEEELKTASFKIEDGVSCVSCHGAYRDWVEKHANEFEWKKFRALDRKAKWEKHGMRDLWNPLQRAALCASCHVGSKSEEKFITHDMYAAGHPPLPGFELGAYTRGMPLHWQRLRDKKPAIAKEQGHSPGDLEETQDVMVGGGGLAARLDGAARA